MRRESWGGKVDEMVEYRREIREHPERFVRMSDLVAEATANVARRRQRKAGSA
jgi:hypothetical protein